MKLYASLYVHILGVIEDKYTIFITINVMNDILSFRIIHKKPDYSLQLDGFLC